MFEKIKSELTQDTTVCVQPDEQLEQGQEITPMTVKTLKSLRSDNNY